MKLLKFWLKSVLELKFGFRLVKNCDFKNEIFISNIDALYCSTQFIVLILIENIVAALRYRCTKI